MPIMPGIGATSVAFRATRARPAIKRSHGGDSANAKAQRAAAKAMTDCEIQSGMTAEQLTAKQRELKAAMYERLRASNAQE